MISYSESYFKLLVSAKMCIRDRYYAAKGSEFDNVFVPFANEANTCKRNAFYVACTRSSRNLYISYTGKRTSFLKDVSKENIVEIENN